MLNISKTLTVAIVVGLARVVSFAAQNALPVPPVKPGLWETKMSQLDGNGREVPSPELAGLARMPPETRARMAAAMRARGVQLPDENGVMKACLTKETFESGAWQQTASESGCTTTFSTRSTSTWKWHSSCAALKAESDGETVFNGSEGYRTKVTTTATVRGTPSTSTRIVQGKWLGAACGDVTPLKPPTGRGKQ